MSLGKLLSQVLKDPPQVSSGHEIDVLHELPVQTLYFALKEADTDMALWFVENSHPSQLQGLLDLDCWSSDQFEPARFMNFFHFMARCSPQRLRLLARDLDPELYVRTLMEFCDVIDFNAEEPPQVAEDQLLITPDHRYALILKTEDRDLRETLMLWLDKLSATDIDLMRRHLESCKWEQLSDLEEFAYGIKKGRLEDHGFVDYSDAIALYAKGTAAQLKTELLANPLPEKSKSEAVAVSPSLDGNFIPEVIREPLSESEYFANAIKLLEDTQIKEVLVLESLRTINMAIMADKLIHASPDAIKEAASRTRKYLDLGLFYLSDGKVERCKELLASQPLMQITRLGWLLIHDLTHAADILRGKLPSQIWGLSDGFLLQKLSGRHPELFESELLALGSKNKHFLSLESVSKCAERLAILGSIKQLILSKLHQSLNLERDPLTNSESLYSRLLTGMTHQLLNSKFSVQEITLSDWDKLVEIYNRDSYIKLIVAFCSELPDNIQLHMNLRLQECLDDLDHYLRNNKSFPKPEIFTALRIQNTEEMLNSKTPGNIPSA